MSGIGRPLSVCRAADACYHSEHHCCTDNSLQCIMRSVMHSASERVHSITSLVPAQLSNCNTIHQHDPLLDGRSLSGLVIWRALFSPGSVNVYPCDINTHTHTNQTWLFCTFFCFVFFVVFFLVCPTERQHLFWTRAIASNSSSKMRAIVLHSAV